MDERVDPIAEIKGFSGEGTISGPGLNKEMQKGKSKRPLIILVFIVLLTLSALGLVFI